jgi:hypothetical protein
MLKTEKEVNSLDLPVNKIISASLKDPRLRKRVSVPEVSVPISREEQLLYVIKELNAELNLLRNQNKDK